MSCMKKPSSIVPSSSDSFFSPVSHDRTFIARVANRIVELRDGELVLYRGDYAYYLEKKDEEAALLRQAEEDEAREAKRAANRAKQKAKAESRRKRPT